MNLDYDFFLPDENAQREIADKLDFDYSLGSQDWEYEVSHIRTVEEYIQLYLQINTSDKAKSSLLEMIINSIEFDLEDNKIQEWDKRFQLHLSFIEKALEKNFDLHKVTMVYWIQYNWKISDHLLNIIEKMELEGKIRWR